MFYSAYIVAICQQLLFISHFNQFSQFIATFSELVSIRFFSLFFDKPLIFFFLNVSNKTKKKTILCHKI